MMKPLESFTVHSKGAIWPQHAHDKDEKASHLGTLTFTIRNA